MLGNIEEYLRQIKDNPDINQWDTLYTHLDAKEPLLRSVRLQDERGGRGELDVKDVVAQEKRLIISGASGMGKTTTLKWLTLVYAENYPEGAERLIPFYVDLGRFKRGMFYDHALMNAHENGLMEEDFKKLLDDGKLAIFLDGLDLLGGSEDFEPVVEIQNFMSEFSRCKFVLSSRPGFFEGFKSSCKVSELVELDDPKIKGYIHKYLGGGDKADTLISRIFDSRNERLKLLCKNPMMLHLVIWLQENDKIADDRAGIYEGIITHYREKGRVLSSNEQLVRDVLKELAFSMQKENTVRLDYGNALDIAGSCITPGRYGRVSEEQVLEDCFRLGLLNKDDGEVGFGFHQSFQEYFAAVKLKEIFEQGYDISESFSHPKWEDALVFLTEITEHPDELFDDVIGADKMFLAARLTAQVDDHRVENLCARLLDQVDGGFALERGMAVESFVYIGDRAVEALIGILIKDGAVGQYGSADELGKLGDTLIIESLIAVMHDDDSGARFRAANALGKIGDERAIEPLIAALGDDYSFMRREAAVVLGELGGEGTIEPLIDVLHDEDSGVRLGAANALGKVGGERAVEPLIDVLHDEDSGVRLGAANALGKVGGERAVEPLIDVLHDEDSGVRSRAALILGKMGDERAIEPLIAVMHDDDSWDRMAADAAATTLKSLCRPIHKEKLEPFLKSNHNHIKNTVSEILHSIKLEEQEKIKIFKELKEKPITKAKSTYTTPSGVKDAEEMLADAHLGALVDRLKLVPDSITVVDYGCGKGAFLCRMKEIERELGNIHYIGVDISRGNRYLAGITAKRCGVADKLKSCDFMKPDEFFSKNIDIDHVFFSHVIHEIFLKDLPEILYNLLSKMKVGSRITILEQVILVEPERDFVTWGVDDFDMLFSGFAESSPRPYKTGRGHELISVDLERLNTDVSLESMRERCLEVYEHKKERVGKERKSSDLSEEERGYLSELYANIVEQMDEYQKSIEMGE